MLDILASGLSLTMSIPATRGLADIRRARAGQELMESEHR
jgi:hypothetical protein